MPNTLMPHMNMRQSPMAYSPQTGYLYATACVNPAWVRRDETGWAFIRPLRMAGVSPYGLIAAIDGRTDKIVWQKRLAYAACQNGAGATATAGNLVFHIEADGTFQAYDAKTGDIRWQFQTGEVGLSSGAGPGGGPAVVYEHGGEQHVAVVMNRAVWAFKLGGSVPPRPAPVAPPTTIAWSGQVQETATLSLGVVNNFNIQSAGKRFTWTDEYAVAPARARTKAGTPVTWKNTSTRPHTIAARDQSWTTGVIQPGTTGSAIIAKPGTYEYICSDHPWTIGQLIVE
jgi:plastocyanin